MSNASRSSLWAWAVGLLGLLAAIAAGAYASRFLGTSGGPPSARPPAHPADIAEQIQTFCGTSCHAYPPPDSFPREHWRMEVERGYRFSEQAGLPGAAPPFESVVHYYEENAPREYPPIAWPAPSRPAGVSWQTVSYPGPPTTDGFAVSHVNLVRLPDPSKPASAKSGGALDILACDMKNGHVMLLRPYEDKPAWKVLARLSHPAHAEVVDLDGDGILDVVVADLGSFGPTDRRCGSVVWLRGNKDGSFAPVKLLDNVGRVADVRAADFRGLGRPDLVVAVFGWQATGELLLLENQGGGGKAPTFAPRVLDNRHGTIHVPVIDLNKDGRPDFVALISQEHETVVAFLNEGGGKFRKETLYSAPHPGYGSSGIELVDLDGDGEVDVLYTNGDSLDKPYLFKPYHGLQWLKNKGNLRFEHQALTPMYGVHRAVAADLRGTGRKDIVAVSFLPEENFPDRKRRKPDGIVLLEQRPAEKGPDSPLRFDRYSLSSTDCDHVTCTVGDVFGTGRNDIVVGNFSSTLSKDPVVIWKNLGPPAEKGAMLRPLPSPFTTWLGRPPEGNARRLASGPPRSDTGRPMPRGRADSPGRGSAR
jgi:hypothetical protein